MDYEEELEYDNDFDYELDSDRGERQMDFDADLDDDFLIDGVGFADPGGNSALRAATKSNPRVHPCPECERENVPTPADVARSYVCDICADQKESGF